MTFKFIYSSLLSIPLLLTSLLSTAGEDADRISRTEYITTWQKVAVDNMNSYKIPASITLAQAILESGDGNSELAKMSNNHFGIKCHDWKGEKVYYDDDRKSECFRKYKNARESFADHSEFLKRKRYASLFDLKLTDYKGWAKGLKKCGYATNPAYARLLIDLIEKNELYKYDKQYNENHENFLARTEIKSKPNSKETKKKSNGKKIPSQIVLRSSRTINKSDNNINYVLAKDGESPESIAESLDLPVWVIRKYNDMQEGEKLTEGQLVYIQPKRSKAKKSFHVFKAEDSMKSISQFYGIKLKALYKKNNIPFGKNPEIGTKLSLQKKLK